MKRGDLLRHLRHHGCTLKREGANHSLWTIRERVRLRPSRDTTKYRIHSLARSAATCPCRSWGARAHELSNNWYLDSSRQEGKLGHRSFLSKRRFSVGSSYCHKCSRYLIGRARNARFTHDPDALTAMVGRTAGLVDAGDFATAIKEHHAFGDGKKTEDHHLEATVEIRRCKTCTTNWFQFRVQKRAGNDWKEVSELTFDTYRNKALRLVK